MGAVEAGGGIMLDSLSMRLGITELTLPLEMAGLFLTPAPCRRDHAPLFLIPSSFRWDYGFLMYLDFSFLFNLFFVWLSWPDGRQEEEVASLDNSY